MMKNPPWPHFVAIPRYKPPSIPKLLQAHETRRNEALRFNTTKLRTTNNNNNCYVRTSTNKNFFYYNNKYHDWNNNDGEDDNYDKQPPESKDNDKDINDITTSVYYTKITTKTTIILQYL